MIARKRLHLIVIALCLWLPLQAIAGQWLHCAQLEFSLTQLDATPEAKPHHSCHEIPANAQTDQLIPADQAPSSADIKSCKYCQFSCGWHSALVLREFTQPSVYSTIIYPQFIALPPAQPLLAAPQRPPRFHV